MPSRCQIRVYRTNDNKWIGKFGNCVYAMFPNFVLKRGFDDKGNAIFEEFVNDLEEKIGDDEVRSAGSRSCFTPNVFTYPSLISSRLITGNQSRALSFLESVVLPAPDLPVTIMHFGFVLTLVFYKITAKSS